MITHSHQSGMRIYTFYIISTLFVILTSCLGCTIGYILFPESVNPEKGWYQLRASPEPITRLLGAELYTVYVQTKSGKLMECDHISSFDYECWKEIKTIPEITSYDCGRRDNTPPSKPMGVIVDSVTFDICHRFGQTTFIYLLLDNGYVYQWGSDDFTWIPGIRYTMVRLLYIILGTSIGLSMAVVAVRWVLRRGEAHNHRSLK